MIIVRGNTKILYNNFLSEGFKWLIEQCYGILGSYGWSIIAVTVAFRLLILPLDIKNKKNTRKQQALQPKIAAIQKKYANDKEKVSQKTMELYKQEGFNPMAGCLPMLIQMPIFFAFFGALNYIAGTQVIEMYKLAESGKEIQVEGWLWVKNIWQADNFNKDVMPEFTAIANNRVNAVKELVTDLNITEESYNLAFADYVALYAGQKNGLFILPIVAGGLSFLQMKLAMPSTPASNANKKDDQPANPMSGKMMQYMMPFMSVFICMTASAAFALYWSASNLVSVANYYVMNKVFAAKEEEESTIVIEEKPSKKMERKLPKI